MADVTVALVCVQQRQFRRRVITAPALWGSTHVTCPMCGEEVKLQVQGPMVNVVKAVSLAFLGAGWIWAFCSWHLNWWHTRSAPLALTDYGTLLLFFIMGPTAGIALAANVVMLFFDRVPSVITQEQSHRIQSSEVTEWPDRS